MSFFTEETKERDSPLGFTRQSTVSSAPDFSPRREQPRGRAAGAAGGSAANRPDTAPPGRKRRSKQEVGGTQRRPVTNPTGLRGRRLDQRAPTKASTPPGKGPRPSCSPAVTLVWRKGLQVTGRWPNGRDGFRVHEQELSGKWGK